MKLNWKTILTFIIVLFLYFLPSIIFPADVGFYQSLEGPKLPPIVFSIIWAIIYITMAIFVTYYLYYVKQNKSSDTKRLFTFLIINYIISSSFNGIFFGAHHLFLSYVVAIFTFVTILLVALESLLLSKKTTLLTIPYVLWSFVATILAIMTYLQN